MYKKQSGQMGIEDFGMPLGLKLSSDNRWVKKAATVPWDAIEEKYAALFKSVRGKAAKPLRLALGSLIIKTTYQFSDEEVALQIQENPYFQYFCGLRSYTGAMPFDASLMTYFRRRLTPEIMAEINELIIAQAEGQRAEAEAKKRKGDKGGGSGGGGASGSANKGTLIVDATCAPQNIAYPTDLGLLNDARESLEQMVDELHSPADGKKPRTYRKEARMKYVRAARNRKKKKGALHKAMGEQLGYIERDLGIIEAYKARGRFLSEKMSVRLETCVRIFWQHVFRRNNQGCSIPDRIVSLCQPWVRPIVRGKAKNEYEFGAKIEFSIAGGFTRLEHSSFDPYNESTTLIGTIERYKERAGFYPKKVLADKIYRTADNVKYCLERHIEIPGSPLGKAKKELTETVRKLYRKAEIDRIEVERKIGLAKGSYGLGLVTAKLDATSLTAIAASVLCLNIGRALRVLFAFFQKWLAWLQNLSASYILAPRIGKKMLALA